MDLRATAPIRLSAPHPLTGYHAPPPLARRPRPNSPGRRCKTVAGYQEFTPYGYPSDHPLPSTLYHPPKNPACPNRADRVDHLTATPWPRR